MNINNNKLMYQENGYSVVFNDFTSLKKYLGLTDFYRNIDSIDDIEDLYRQFNEDIHIQREYNAIIKYKYCGIEKEYFFSDKDIAEKTYNNLRHNSNVDDVALYLIYGDNATCCASRRTNSEGTKLFLRFLNNIKKLKSYELDGTKLTYDDNNGFHIKYSYEHCERKVQLHEIANMIGFETNRCKAAKDQIKNDFGWDLNLHPAEYHDWFN